MTDDSNNMTTNPYLLRSREESELWRAVYVKILNVDDERPGLVAGALADRAVADYRERVDESERQALHDTAGRLAARADDILDASQARGAVSLDSANAASALTSAAMQAIGASR